MPGIRSEGQVLIGCKCKSAFVAKIDNARGNLTRSQFCRDALAESLRRLGYAVTTEEIAPPDRAGKGGPKPKIPPAVPAAEQPIPAQEKQKVEQAAAEHKRKAKRGRHPKGPSG